MVKILCGIDTLSPFLFILAMGGLSDMLKTAQSNQGRLDE